MNLATFAEQDSTRKKIIYILLAFALVDSLVAVFAYNDDEPGISVRTAVTDIEAMLTAGTAAVLATIVVARQGIDGLHGKTYAALAIGMLMWFSGEIVWTYYEVGLQIELPSYSMADVFWLFGYGFIGYHLFKTYVYFSKVMNKAGIIAVGFAASVAISFLVYWMFLDSNLETIDGVITFLFRISYPVGDFVLIVPSILLLATLRNAKLHFSPWFFISIAFLVTAAADILFSYFSLLEKFEGEWVANLLYNSANLCLAGGLYWYNKFILFDPAKAEKQRTSKEKGD